MIKQKEHQKQRLSMLHDWLSTQHNIQPDQLKPLTGDASFRRYFRINTEGENTIIMDAPPPAENCYPFVCIAKTLKKSGLTVPEIIAHDLQHGFLLLSDFGDHLLFDNLNTDNADHYYRLALNELLILQSCKAIHDYEIPHFDQSFIRHELHYFNDWYLTRYRKMTLNHQQQQRLQHTYQMLIDSATEQPQVLIHRDYHSRNLMLVKPNQIGLIDFQDAMWGPISYDVVSLLRDCYISWPYERVTQWALDYYALACERELLTPGKEQVFTRHFDWMGIQRHLKVLGIFSRLYLRDHKKNYLQHMPRILNYLLEVSQQYPELNDFHYLLRELCEKP